MIQLAAGNGSGLFFKRMSPILAKARRSKLIFPGVASTGTVIAQIAAHFEASKITPPRKPVDAQAS